jgi:hypothetical protein
MKILFIYYNTPELIMPTLPLGLVCVATAVKRDGHEVQLLEIQAGTDPRQALLQAIRDMQPDAVGVSVRNIDDQTMHNTRFLLDPVRAIVAACREFTDAPVSLGAPGTACILKASLRISVQI